MAYSFRASAAAMALLGLLACSRNQQPAYVTELTDRGTVRDVVTATGQVQARVQVDVGSQVSGTLRSVNVTWNDVVKAGDVLAELDPRLYQAQLARAAASVALARANVAKAEVDLHDRRRSYARVVALHANALVAQVDLEVSEVARDQAVAALAGAAATLTQALADRDQAQTNLALTQIKSPIDGVVLDRLVDAGQTVAAQFQVATLFTIAADMHEVQVVVSVDEADVGKLHAPLAAEFRVAAYPQQAFAGTVVAVRPAPTAGASTQSTAVGTGTVVTYAAVVEAKNPEGLLRQGMTAELTVVVEQREDVVRLPVAALRWMPASSQDLGPPAAPASHQATVYVLRNGVAEARQITTDLSDGQFVAVSEGLAANEAVILADNKAPSKSSSRGRRSF